MTRSIGVVGARTSRPFARRERASGRKMAWLTRTMAVALLAGLTACSAESQPRAAELDERPPTRMEAERVLDATVRLALKEGAAALCDERNGLTDGSDMVCLSALEDVGEESTPTEPPRVVGFKVGPRKPFAAPWAELILEGVDGLGRPYRQDLYILRDDGKVFARSPIWWSKYSGVADDGGASCKETRAGGLECSTNNSRGAGGNR